MVDLAEIFRRHWPAYQEKFADRILPSHAKLVRAVLACRTPSLGGHVYRCAPCARDHFVYHSCNHRACPKCGHHQATAWIEQQKARLLPVPYYLITFTVPSQLRELIASQQKRWYGWLFSQSSLTLQEVASREKYLGATLGLLGVLHTWTRDLRFHPHVHYLVPAGGLTEDGLRWRRPKDPEFFLPHEVLAQRFRNRLKKLVRREDPRAYSSIKAKVWKLDWVADVQPVGQGESALKYLSAYIYKTALCSQRLIACDEHGVSFLYRERDSNTWKPAHLSGEAFLHRFLQHVLPRGFVRVRSYGWRSPAAKKRWQTILALLDWKTPQIKEAGATPIPTCPKCRKPMACLGSIPRGPPRPP